MPIYSDPVREELARTQQIFQKLGAAGNKHRETMEMLGLKKMEIDRQMGLDVLAFESGEREQKRFELEEPGLEREAQEVQRAELRRKQPVHFGEVFKDAGVLSQVNAATVGEDWAKTHGFTSVGDGTFTKGDSTPLTWADWEDEPEFFRSLTGMMRLGGGSMEQSMIAAGKLPGTAMPQELLKINQKDLADKLEWVQRLKATGMSMERIKAMSDEGITQVRNRITELKGQILTPTETEKLTQEAEKRTLEIAKLKNEKPWPKVNEHLAKAYLSQIDALEAQQKELLEFGEADPNVIKGIQDQINGHIQAIKDLDTKPALEKPPLPPRKFVIDPNDIAARSIDDSAGYEKIKPLLSPEQIAAIEGERNRLLAERETKPIEKEKRPRKPKGEVKGVALEGRYGPPGKRLDFGIDHHNRRVVRKNKREPWRLPTKKESKLVSEFNILKYGETPGKKKIQRGVVFGK